MTNSGSAKKPSDWSNNHFAVWLGRNGFCNEEAAELLGVSSRMIINYCNGSHPVHKMLKLACLAIESGLRA